MEVARALHELSQTHTGLDTVNFKRAAESGDLIAVVVGAGDVKSVIGRGGRTVKELNERLKKKVQVTDEGTGMRKMSQDILAPARVLGVNILYSGNRETYRVRVPRHDERRLPASVDTVQALLEKITDKNIKIVFE